MEMSKILTKTTETTNNKSVQKPFSSLAFFALPKDYRRGLWIENSGNPELTTLPETARRVVCQKHFRPSSLRIQFHRTILSRDAIPDRLDADNYLNTSSVEPIELIQCDDSNDDRQLEENKVLQIDDEFNYEDTRQDVSDWHNNSVDQADGIEFVEIDNDELEHLQTTDDCAAEINEEAIDEDDQTRQRNQFPPFFHEVEIETADSGKRKTFCTSNGLSVEITNQSSIKLPLEQEERENVQCNGVASDVSVSSTSKSDKNIASTEEDKYFALALVGMLQRISPQKKAFVKVNILRYLTELEYGVDSTL